MTMTSTDRQLLETFVARQDPSAFGSLVDRHGPAVLRVCRFVLRDPHDAEDAFQATFLVFLRRAPSIQDPERLGKWLCGVAYRVAVRARARAADRRRREERKAAMAATTSAPASDRDEHWEELGPALREELDRLPEKYRAPLLLCYLEGLTHEEAARHLGWPVGTVKVRLVRARRELRSRLDRGKLGGALLLLLMLPKRTPAAVPESLASATVEAMSRVGGGGTATPAGSAHESIAWLEGASRAASWGRRRIWIILALLALATTAAGGIAFGRQGADNGRAADLPGNLTNILDVMCR